MDRASYLRWLMAESPSAEEQLHAWLGKAKYYRSDMSEHRDGVQIQERGITVGLRQSSNLYDGDCLSIHIVRLDEEIQNKGWFKSFLKLCCDYNPWKDVIIEDVKNPHLLAFFRKHDFKVLDKFYPDTYIVNADKIQVLAIPPLKRYEEYLNK